MIDPTQPIALPITTRDPDGWQMTVKDTYRTNVHRDAYARLWGKTTGPMPRVTHFPGDGGTTRKATATDDLEEQRKRELFTAWMHRGEDMRRKASHYGHRTTRARRGDIA